MKSKKDKILKVIFIISIIPYIFVMLVAIWSSIFGLSWFYSKSYGISAFIGTIGLYVFVFGVFFWPIIPYQIFYLIYVRSKKIGSLKRAIINVISVVSIVCAVAMFMWQQSLGILEMILMLIGVVLIVLDKKKYPKEKIDI